MPPGPLMLLVNKVRLVVKLPVVASVPPSKPMLPVSPRLSSDDTDRIPALVTMSPSPVLMPVSVSVPVPTLVRPPVATLLWIAPEKVVSVFAPPTVSTLPARSTTPLVPFRSARLPIASAPPSVSCAPVPISTAPVSDSRSAEPVVSAPAKMLIGVAAVAAVSDVSP